MSLAHLGGEKPPPPISHLSLQFPQPWASPENSVGERCQSLQHDTLGIEVGGHGRRVRELPIFLRQFLSAWLGPRNTWEEGTWIEELPPSDCAPAWFLLIIGCCRRAQPSAGRALWAVPFLGKWACGLCFNSCLQAPPLIPALASLMIDYNM